MKFKHLFFTAYLFWVGSLITLALILFPGLEKFIVGVKIGVIAFCGTLVWILHTAFSILTPKFSKKWTDDVPIIDFRKLVTFVLLGVTVVLISEFLRGLGVFWIKYVLFVAGILSFGLIFFLMTGSAENISLKLSWRFHQISMILLLFFLSGAIVY